MLLRLLLPIWSIAVLLLSAMGPAQALDAIAISPDQERIEITTLGQLYEGRGDSLQVETAASADGTTGRMAVRATTPGTNPSWLVFALTNTSEIPVERWLTADRYTIIGSGIVWPDLDARRVEALTPSVGFVPERLPSDRADIFRITLEPGQTITYIAELSSERLARIYLWKQLSYERKVGERQLFNGIMIGLTSLLAIFLTAIFAANHKVIFPVAALVAWCVLGYLCVDFGFFHKLFQLKPENTAVHRASTEAAMAASLVIFVYFFLRIQMWHGLARMLFGVWIIAQLALVAIAVIDPRLASTFARLSFVAIAAIGGLVTLYLAMRGQDRALSLIPTWVMYCVWVFGAAVTLTGQLTGDLVVSGLVAGLVLIVLLIGFTVTQFAFRSLEPLYGAAPSELQLRSAAVEAAGAAVWEWTARRDEIKVGNVLESALGLNQGELNTKVDDFCRHMHPADRERFRLSLVATQERSTGSLQTDFRMRHADNSYRWFALEAAPVPSADGRTVKCVGLLRDVTDQKRAQYRLVSDAFNCRLTGLPNREILLDRLQSAVKRAETDSSIRPTILYVDLDKFKSINSSYGIVVGDSLLLTVARRLQRHLELSDTIARVGGDQFAILLLKEQPAAELAWFAERVRRSLRSPIKIAGQDIVLTGSIGIAIWDGRQSTEVDLLREAEIAMYRAKRAGTDQIEIFRAEMRSEPDERAVAANEVRKAVERNQLKLLFQPIVYLPTEELAGFEVSLLWEHSKHGRLNPFAIVEQAGLTDLMQRMTSETLTRAVKECDAWQTELPRTERPLFVSMRIPSASVLELELSQHIRQILGANAVPKGSLKLGISEAIVMDNPERATEMLEWFRGAGAELVLDDFGGGYSSLPYLGRLPFEAFRIDRLLLEAEGGREGSSPSVVKAMVALAHEFGRKVIVEGVETDEEVGFLRSIECEYAEGLYYGEPINERDVVQLLKLVRKSERRLQPRGLFRLGQKARKPKTEEATPPAAEPAAPLASEDAAVSPPMLGIGAGAEVRNPHVNGQVTSEPQPPIRDAAEPIIVPPVLQGPAAPSAPPFDVPHRTASQSPENRVQQSMPPAILSGIAFPNPAPAPYPPPPAALPSNEPYRENPTRPPMPLPPQPPSASMGAIATPPPPPPSPEPVTVVPSGFGAPPFAPVEPALLQGQRPSPPPPPQQALTSPPFEFAQPPARHLISPAQLGPLPESRPVQAEPVHANGLHVPVQPGPIPQPVAPMAAAPRPALAASGDGTPRQTRPLPRPRPENLPPAILASLERLAGKQK